MTKKRTFIFKEKEGSSKTVTVCALEIARISNINLPFDT